MRIWMVVPYFHMYGFGSILHEGVRVDIRLMKVSVTTDQLP